ncbi:uncharacterized protein YehS (DUF1456 family) [Marinoscillum furvescens DSM 4134]|uniref:Uncharacterized protein YehS (DUF1456 family) n=2 Tax=Marinoscillum furvescens TaxID=1026 RepID=A0A3D9L140_MARFU|nr:uncharacterized protein YehS (DUF1456 family) [Marinoscillum furvescens DSM 4134]
MTNNDIFRRLRYIFDFSDDQVIELFRLGGQEVTRAEISNWLKNDEDEAQTTLYDEEMAVFLSGLIVKKRGARDGETPKPEKNLNNNIIFRKLKIALNLKDRDILDVLDRANLEVSKHELSAIFRKPGQKQYRKCKDQFLRNFLLGLQYQYRPDCNKQ